MTTLCQIDDIDNESAKSFECGENSFFAIKKNDQLYVYRNHCPHLGVELNWLPNQFLDMDKALIQCFTHGALFLIEDGECVAGPCLGQRLEAIAFDIVDGKITLRMD